MEVLVQEVESLVVPLPGPTHPVALTPTSEAEETQAAPPVSSSTVPVPKPQPAAPKQTLANPKDTEIKFKPVTRDGMAAFFAAMRRPSTGQLSVASSKENVESQAVLAETQTDSPENVEPILPDNQLGDPTLNLETPPSSAVDSKDIVMEPSPGDQVVGGTSVEVVLPPVPTPPAPSQAVTPIPPVVAPTPVAPVVAATPVAPAAPEEPEGGGVVDKKAQKAQYMRFSRNVCGPNCPPPVKKKFLEAMADQDPVSSAKKIQDLFQEFRRCQEDWTTSQIVLEEKRTSTTTSRGVWKWMSREETCMHIYTIAICCDFVVINC